MVNPLFHFQEVISERVRNINLTVNEKDKIVIFGPSGAGKSSLLLLFNRLQVPSSGVIKYKNQRIEDYDVQRLRKEVGLVLQETNLFPGTVLENLKFGPELFGEWEDSIAEELLEFVRLPVEFLEKDTEQLSGGEQQRINLARTLANQPNVLLLDEPTSALDGKTSEEIETLLGKLMENEKKTMIMVTHDLMQAQRMGEIGIFMEDGELVEMGKLDELLNDPQTETLQNYLQQKS